VHVAIFGTGYVGLVTGTCFAEMGNQVHCVDIDTGKVARLSRGECPIYEIGLPELLEENCAAGRIRFTTDVALALKEAEIAFICVGTPMGGNGEADLSAVESAARSIGRALDHYLVVVGKSTVPVGTAERVRRWIADELQERKAAVDFDVAANPEFLKEGSAVEDFMKPDRVVVGVDQPRAESLLHELYSPFIRNGLRFFAMDIKSAEMTKYAANCMLATKISFINEIANICERVGADVRQVRLGTGADSRIGLQFLHPGVGYGGSCFPKDVRALINMGERAGYVPALLKAVDDVNQRQKGLLLRKIAAWCELSGRRLDELTVAVWGLAFKPNTDDVRDAPALELVKGLSQAGARVRAHDPKAIEAAAKALGKLPRIEYLQDPYACVEGADVLCLMTEWRPYRRPDFRRLARELKARTIFDGRNQWGDVRLAELGLAIHQIGVPPAPATAQAGTQRGR
jgi:UDPglucose 6-dehydrogenase